MKKVYELKETVTVVAEVEVEEKPRRVPPRVKSAPSIRQLFWCDFPEDAHLPEFWKTRPVLIVSYKNILTGAVTVLPCSSQPQRGNPWAVELGTTVDGQSSWVICDKPTTVAVSRLTPDKSGIRRLPESEFNPILALLLKWLPKLPE
ncbi:type II toxin-antitoxin system PemK/MazF family toxin [Bradyrhizobium japonicum]|uniref:type II toxin-antitoxin system PemK/MazF family toxin n=1 Tax=Bradyrhizobium japonicum TaxID=375 RepID=UPI001B89F71C|nr:type II toxin-antitoxin system PemK/MazF family toxin [Bradyrhizobium japonicum]MBR0973659.1 type II toxin-antitoxin system PemK/MazF family toxin [Bradyrhizobium japonicum]